ncbi:DUF305 domain-containing protein [Cellulomonas marina]|uniref:Uncharacterized conserved protein, DUF305 family n=1 Tax=Cellulomonas marina TaxID=988821 RepID=A0A1I0YH95_9CELL|nr:DUF305 domain-containing protein [Cellulomonas marina]GIG28724.1 hypothetical protein Cma02nite_13240 [Cellulomonas marina]SFB11870.1 Uncharacterized conserved protein, DUF305 family [Cellulomonas marina]
MTRSTHRLLAGATALVVAAGLAACGGSDGGAGAASGAASGADGATASAGATHAAADVAFAQMMVVHHEGAIDMADLAVERAGSEDVRALAGRISAAQGPEIATMTGWLEAWGEDVSADAEAGHDMEGHDTEGHDMEGHGGSGHDMAGMTMDGLTQEEAMAELEGLEGAAFDRRFLELMVAHHEGAVTMAEQELEEGRAPEATELAGRVVEDQTAEIAQMRELLAGL